MNRRSVNELKNSVKAQAVPNLISCTMTFAIMIFLSLWYHVIVQSGSENNFRNKLLKKLTGFDNPVHLEATDFNDKKVVHSNERWQDCKHIFIDLGANIGINARFLFEPHLFPGMLIFKFWAQGFYNHVFENMKRPLGWQVEGRTFLPIFQLLYPVESEYQFRSSEMMTLINMTRSDVCYFGFEMNPYHHERLVTLQSCLVSQGWRVQFYNPVAVWNETSHLPISIKSSKREQTNEYWGTHVDYDENRSTSSESSDENLIPSLDISQFILDNFSPQMMNPESKLIVKMDIEGAESVVLPRLSDKSLLCRGVGIDLMTIEFHEWASKDISSLKTKYRQSTSEIKRTFQGRSKESVDGTDKWIGEYLSSPLTSECEPTLVIEIDDETYRTEADNASHDLTNTCPGVQCVERYIERRRQSNFTSDIGTSTSLGDHSLTLCHSITNGVSGEIILLDEDH